MQGKRLLLCLLFFLASMINFKLKGGTYTFLSSDLMGSGRKPDALHIMHKVHQTLVIPGAESSGSAQISQKILSAEHSKQNENLDSMILNKTLVLNSNPRNNAKKKNALASRSGMISTDFLLRGGEENVGVNRKSQILDLSFSMTKLENDEVKQVVSEITKQVVSEITKQVDSETKSKVDASTSKSVESFPESNINLESLNAKMDRLAAELHRTQVEFMRYRNIHLVPSKQPNPVLSKQSNLLSKQSNPVPSKQTNHVSRSQVNPVSSKEINPVPSNQGTHSRPNQQTNPLSSKHPAPSKKTHPVPSKQTNPVLGKQAHLSKQTSPVSSKHPVPSKQINLKSAKQTKPVPSKQTNSMPSKQPDDLVQANVGKSDGDAKMAETNLRDAKMAESNDNGHEESSTARTTVQGKQMLRFGAMDRPQPGSDDNGVYIRREPLHNKPIYFSSSNSTPIGRPRYYMNRPDPNRELMESRGIVVSAWPGMESHSHSHSWGYDSENYYSGHHYTRPLFNYSGAQHPYWAYNNHAMRSQPEFFDPDGTANKRLVLGSMPGVFGDRWRKPNDHHSPVDFLAIPFTPAARGSAVMTEEAVHCRQL
jgi:hypothetical protein